MIRLLHKFTPTYHPQLLGKKIVNMLIKSPMRMMLELQPQEHWDQAHPKVLLGINLGAPMRTQSLPFEVLLG